MKSISYKILLEKYHFTALLKDQIVLCLGMSSQSQKIMGEQQLTVCVMLGH